jgi:hypothetical protein
MSKTVVLLAVVALSAVACVTAWQRDSHWERVGYASSSARMMGVSFLGSRAQLYDVW